MTVRPFFYIPMPHRLRTPPRIWAPKASLRGSYTRFIDLSTPFFDFGPLPHDHFGHNNVVIAGNVNKPGKSDLDPPLAEGEIDDGATFSLHTRGPPTTPAP